MNNVDAFIKSPQYQNAISELSELEGGILGLDYLYSFFGRKWCSEKGILLSWLFIIGAIFFIAAGIVEGVGSYNKNVLLGKFDNIMSLLKSTYGNYVYPLMKKVLSYVLNQPTIKPELTQIQQLLSVVDVSNLFSWGTGAAAITTDVLKLTTALRDFKEIETLVSVVCVLIRPLEEIVSCVGGVCRTRA